MTAAEKRELARLEKRALELLRLGERHEARARRAFERGSEVDERVYQLKLKHGLVPPPGPPVDSGKVVAILKRVYSR